ncbi:MAG TPA: radical SAM protein [Firmicutes bacterium]|nr:radical SAM protein [Bacillota bacterium]
MTAGPEWSRKNREGTIDTVRAGVQLMVSTVRAGVQLVTCKTALSRTGIPGHKYCLNPYTGCRHGCLYCYAPVILRFSPVSDAWGTKVQAKVNIPEMLSKEVSRKRTPVGNVMVGSVTDPYQPCEEQLGLTRRCLEILGERPDASVSILTKSALVTRDVDLFRRWVSRNDERSWASGNGGGNDGGVDHPPGPRVSVGFTITVLDDGTAKAFEAGASSPSERLKAARRLVQEGIPVWVFVAPVLPGIGDSPESLEDLLSAIRDAGISEVSFDRLNPYPRSVALLRAAYRRRFPSALPALEQYLLDPITYWADFEMMAKPLVERSRPRDLRLHS